MVTNDEKMQTIDSNIHRSYRIVFAMLIFVGLFCFFYVVHPIYIYDSDDWTYVSYSRQALPSLNQWNPTKVLPETLMPLISEIGVRFVCPINGDYVRSIALVFALFIATVITIYTVMALNWINVIFELKPLAVCIIGGVYLLSHFFPFNIADINNRHIFYGGNANCYFNYIIPGLFNTICVLIFLGKNIQKYKSAKENPIRSGFLLLLIYLCINSNMFHSIILISFLGSKMLIEFTKELMSKKKLLFCIISTVKANVYETLVIIAWLISITIESKGARAQWAAGTTLRNLPVVYCFRLFIKSVRELNHIWLYSSIIIIILAILSFVLTAKNRKVRDEKFLSITIKLVIAQFITIVYLILLCAKVSSEYIQNNTVMYSWIIWTMLIVLYSLGYLVSKWKYFGIVLPLALYLLVFNTVIDGKKYADNNVVWCYGTDTVKEIDDYIIEEITKADKAGLDYLELKMPITDSNYWPLDISYAGDRMASTLYTHGLIKRRIHVVIVPDKAMNERFGVGTATTP